MANLHTLDNEIRFRRVNMRSALRRESRPPWSLTAAAFAAAHDEAVTARLLYARAVLAWRRARAADARVAASR